MDDTPTTLFPAVSEPPPVFVDPSGLRRRRLRRIAYALGLAGLAYTAMVGVSFAGTPVSPETILPYVEPTQQPWQPPPPLPSGAGPEGAGPAQARPTAPGSGSSTVGTSGSPRAPATQSPAGDLPPRPGSNAGTDQAADPTEFAG